MTNVCVPTAEPDLSEPFLKKPKLDGLGLRRKDFTITKIVDGERKTYICNSDNSDDSDDDVSEEIKGLWKKYVKSVNQSQGFDVIPFEPSYAFGIIRPLGDPSTYEPEVFEEVNNITEKAVVKYNLENGTTYKLSKVVKANLQFACGKYYITFEAVDSSADGAPATTFQALGIIRFDEWSLENASVDFVRIEGSRCK